MVTIYTCSRCGAKDAHEYYYPDGTGVTLCDECGHGVFCYSCGAFVGGTEDIFWYGGFCEDCYDEYEKEHDRDYDESDWED